MITPNNAEHIYKECLNYPEFIDDLDLYEAKKVLSIAETNAREFQSDIVREMNANPEYDYPESYLPDRCFQYWMERTEYGGVNTMENYKLCEKLKERIEQIEGTANPLVDLIKEFADEFSKDAKFSSETIQLYLIIWEDMKGVKYRRSRAKKKAKLEKVADGTLRNWEEKWTKFHNSRTKK